MGSVWLARNELTEREFAVKLLHAAAAGNPRLLMRFFQEAKVSGKIRHPSILEIFDVGTAPELGGAPFLVMELLEGASLDILLAQRGALPLRVTLEVNASADMTWVVVTDPIPGGSTLLGGGLGRDSQIATQGQQRPSGSAWPAFEERSFEAFRGYFEYVPKGVFKVEYTLRLNNVGEFALPPSRVEAMYAPEMFGETPNARVKVEPGR